MTEAEREYISAIAKLAATEAIRYHQESCIFARIGRHWIMAAAAALFSFGAAVGGIVAKGIM